MTSALSFWEDQKVSGTWYSIVHFFHKYQFLQQPIITGRACGSWPEEKSLPQTVFMPKTMLILKNLIPNLARYSGGAEGPSFILHMADLGTTVESTSKIATMSISVHNVTLQQSCLEGPPFSPERPRHHKIMRSILVTIANGTDTNYLLQKISPIGRVNSWPFSSKDSVHCKLAFCSSIVLNVFLFRRLKIT